MCLSDFDMMFCQTLTFRWPERCKTYQKGIRHDYCYMVCRKEELQIMSGQINTETYVLAAHISLSDAAKAKTIAERQGVSLSKWVAELVRAAVRGERASATNLGWAESRRSANVRARAIADERTVAGRYRKQPYPTKG